MDKPYYVFLDFKNTKMRQCALEQVLSAAFIDKICVVEKVGFFNRMFADAVGDLIVFDDKFESEKEIFAYCKNKLRFNPNALFIHIGKEPSRDDNLHLIGISDKCFLEHFERLLGVCFLVHIVRTSVINPHKMI